MAFVVVSGANRGIGLEFCRQLLARGDHVVAGCRKPGRAQALNALAFEHPGRLNVLPLDLTRPDTIVEFAREFALVGERLDLLINNAAISPEGERFGALEQRHLVDAFATNAAGALLMSQALAQVLLTAQAPRIMNLSSDLGSLTHRNSFYTPSYCISKAALNMVTRLLAAELGGRGVVCFSVNPGWVKTDMGGARAPLPVAESVASLIALAGRADPSFNGGFFERNGEAIPVVNGTLHVVLVAPEIPPNTGNVIRLCANTGAALHLIEPLGFALDDARLKRAGLDYHEYAALRTHATFDAFLETVAPPRWFAYSAKAQTRFDQVRYAAGDALVFGCETGGLPQALLDSLPPERRLRLPMRPKSRSLNLSNAVAVAVYEAWRQLGFEGASPL